EQLIRMAECLHRGEIPANPARGKRHDYTCTYCDFRAICRLEEEQYQEDKAHYKEIKDINHQDALALLNGAAASDGKEEAQDGRTS
ncbi:MAG TPA: hypothetical protein PLS28_05485, partial [Clostridiales bacterium]|nr:hypothetical protein [Clostridiales bacterium]